MEILYENIFNNRCEKGSWGAFWIFFGNPWSGKYSEGYFIPWCIIRLNKLKDLCWKVWNLQGNESENFRVFYELDNEEKVNYFEWNYVAEYRVFI